MKDKRVIFHPILFAIYPILELYFNLQPTVQFSHALRVLILAPLFALALMFALKWFFKDWDRAAFLTSLILFLLLYYGILYRVGWKLRIGNLRLGKHIFLFPAWAAALFFIGSRWTWKQLRDHKMVTKFLNFASAVAVVMSLSRFALNRITHKPADTQSLASSTIPQQETDVELESEKGLPDIYYLIVDGYGRADLLQEMYDFDNVEFLDYLDAQGFYVAEQAQSNYIQTALAMASTLNYEYLDPGYFTPDVLDRKPLDYLIKNNKVRRLLEQQGYRLVTTDTGYVYTLLDDADIFIMPEHAKTPVINAFEGVVIMSSAAVLLVDAGLVDVPVIGYQAHRDRVEYAFSLLSQIPEFEGPKFAFFHIIIPHPPFVFDEEGNKVSPGVPYSGGGDGGLYLGFPDQYIEGYRRQVAYTNKLLKRAVDDILAKSATPPIIIIQGDHGPGALLSWGAIDETCIRERVSILNAYYFPDGDYDALYPSISPVNSFRVIFDTYFGTDLGLLEDHTYYSPWDRLYDFVEVGERSQVPCVVP